jgi:quinol monooxygenase YgiN
MPTISKGRAPLTLINVFTVTPEKQFELIELLTDVTEQNVRHHRGFVSASLHRAIDGKKVTMYAQWASVEGLRNHASKFRSRARAGESAQDSDVRSGDV